MYVCINRQSEDSQSFYIVLSVQFTIVICGFRFCRLLLNGIRAHSISFLLLISSCFLIHYHFLNPLHLVDGLVLPENW